MQVQTTLNNGCVHNLQLAFAANNQEIGTLGYGDFATGHINSGLRRAHLQHIAAIMLAHGQLLHGFADDGRIIRDLIIG